MTEILTIASMLRGCEVGRMQTVGVMQVVPLLSDLEDDRFVSPAEGRTGTSGYGNMVFENRTSKTMLVPSHAAYMTKERAQDHAMPGAGFVKAGQTKTFDKAMCIQQTQGGYISMDAHKLQMLPLSLREKALEKRSDAHFGKLWNDIATFCHETGLPYAGGHLIEFAQRFEKELDQFVAEFEIVPRQVGAIILIGGKVMGVERSPSHAYFKSIWNALIRECYGAETIRQVKLGWAKAPRVTPLRSTSNLIDLKAALSEARQKEEEAAKDKVRSLLDDPFSLTNDGTNDRLTLHTVNNPQFMGQVVREGEAVLYASLITKSSWASTKTGWREAKRFTI